MVAGVLALIAAWQFYRGRGAIALALLAAAVVLATTALVWPPAARRFHAVWMWIARILGWVNSRVLLSLVFFLLFVPYNLASRLVGRDPLSRRRKSGRASYWVPRKATRQPREQFERLF